MFASFESYRSGLAVSYWATQGCFRAALWISLLLQISIWESAKINASLSSVDSLLPNASWHILFLLLYSGGDLEGRWFPPPMSSHQRLPGCRCEEPSTSATTSTSADHWWSWGVCGVSFKQWGILSWAQRVAAKIREQLMVPLATAAGFLWEAPREGRDTTSVAITAPLSSEKCWQRPGHRMSLPSVHLRQMLWLFPAAGEVYGPFPLPHHSLWSHEALLWSFSGGWGPGNRRSLPSAALAASVHPLSLGTCASVM